MPDPGSNAGELHTLTQLRGWAHLHELLSGADNMLSGSAAVASACICRSSVLSWRHSGNAAQGCGGVGRRCSPCCLGRDRRCQPHGDCCSSLRRCQALLRVSILYRRAASDTCSFHGMAVLSGVQGRSPCPDWLSNRVKGSVWKGTVGQDKRAAQRAPFKGLASSKAIHRSLA